MSSRTRLLVVDDSAFARVNITHQFDNDPTVEVVGAARDGIEALEKIKELRPDVITLDVEMPRMDGLATLKRIMSECPSRVLMLSSLTDAGSAATIQALELGAADFLCKPSTRSAVGESSFGEELREKVHMVAKVDPARLAPASAAIGASSEERSARRPPSQVRLAVIGCSTGGPQALRVLIPALPRDLSFPVLVVQHMPSGFTKAMADRLNGESKLPTKEAEEGDRLTPGRVYIAPGGYHATVNSSGVIRLNQDPPQGGVRPSIDVTLFSVARAMGAATVGVVLTGMGSDGTKGAGLLKEAGGFVIAEAEETCVVYGMPKSVVDAGLADLVLPLHSIAGQLVSYST